MAINPFCMLQAGNPYADFERIFNHFASAEELTGSTREDSSRAQPEDTDIIDAPQSPAVSPPKTKNRNVHG